MKPVIDRRDAKHLGRTKYFTGRPCRAGHSSERYVSNGICCECQPKRMKKWRDKNPAKNLQQLKRYREKHAVAVMVRGARRRTTRLRAMPKWADQTAIMYMYWLARSLTRSTGIKHNVDHIYPLRGKNSCGLHVENNLQILTETANRKKGNKTPSFDSPPRV
jgi:5-methylcytosine-specific restriction endonuclease McrA